MTTEDDFQAALDANPKDCQTRLVFADWLDEHNDPRGPGMRALGVNRIRPSTASVTDQTRLWWYFKSWPGSEDGKIPEDWFDELQIEGKEGLFAPKAKTHRHNTRREVEDAAALAFLKLLSERRAALLAGDRPRRRR
jgi:uncharacterized protein (TIGR02996 family)